MGAVTNERRDKKGTHESTKPTHSLRRKSWTCDEWAKTALRDRFGKLGKTAPRDRRKKGQNGCIETLTDLAGSTRASCSASTVGCSAVGITSMRNAASPTCACTRCERYIREITVVILRLHNNEKRRGLCVAHGKELAGASFASFGLGRRKEASVVHVRTVQVTGSER